MAISVEDYEGPIGVAVTTKKDELIKRLDMQQIRALEAIVQQLSQTACIYLLFELLNLCLVQN